jgi:NADP-dependent 3-hydroxy acid dehydrogenase YdfG
MRDAMKSIVITGVSSGIGYATAELACAQGFQVFGGLRAEADAARLQEKLGAAFTPLLFDVRDGHAIAEAVQAVRLALEGSTLAGLVNNAGTGLAGPLLHQPLEEIRAVLDTNMLGPILATRAFAPCSAPMRRS